MKALVLIAELAGGVVSGCALAILGQVFTLSSSCAEMGLTEMTEGVCYAERLYGMVLGYVLGVPLGVYLIANLLGRRGSFWITCSAGLVIFVIVLSLRAQIQETLLAGDLLIGALAVLSPILAILGFNLGRTWKGGSR